MRVQLGIETVEGFRGRCGIVIEAEENDMAEGLDPHRRQAKLAMIETRQIPPPRVPSRNSPVR